MASAQRMASSTAMCAPGTTITPTHPAHTRSHTTRTRRTGKRSARPHEEGPSDEIGEEAERERQGAHQRRARQVVDEDGQGDLTDHEPEDRERVRDEDGTELAYGEEGR